MDSPALLVRRYTLALCVWREARGESAHGKALVAQVIENRVVAVRWPDTYVGVILQKWQFSAFNLSDPQVLRFPEESDPSWPACVAAADLVLTTPMPLTRANHYHTVGLDPAWRDDTKITEVEGHHVFYRL